LGDWILIMVVLVNTGYATATPVESFQWEDGCEKAAIGRLMFAQRNVNFTCVMEKK